MIEPNDIPLLESYFLNRPQHAATSHQRPLLQVRLLLIGYSFEGNVLAVAAFSKRGKPYEVAFPITHEARKMIEEAIMAEYKTVASEADSPF